MTGSPFPGMDPYLEGELWQEFHSTLANAVRALLLEVLPPKYVALLSKRFVMAQGGLSILGLPPQRVIYPDVSVVKQPSLKEAAEVVYAGPEAPVELVSPLPEEVPLLNVEIRDTAQRRLVTLIEILSPVNKQGSGFREYVERRTGILQTQTHLLEIDLLRAGERIPLIGGELPLAPYYVYLSRFDRRPRTQVWPCALRRPLPTIPVPLLPPDADVPLKLQAAVDACFKLVGYERLLDYAQPPPMPALSAEDGQWLHARVGERAR